MSALLALQERDLEYRKALRSLREVPVERAGIEKRIATEEERLQTARRSLKEAEVNRQKMEAEAEQATEKINRLKNQQLQVRKNEEYEALTHEIQALEDTVGRIEDEELTLLDSIDREKEALAEIETKVNREIEHLRADVEKVNSLEKEERDRIDALKTKVDTMREQVEPKLLARYDSLSTQIKRPPVVVPLENQTCGGCHLRVSNEVESSVRNFQAITCDQCGRLLYLE